MCTIRKINYCTIRNYNHFQSTMSVGWTLIISAVALGDEVGPFRKSTRPEADGIYLMSGMEVEKLRERRHRRLIVYLRLHKK